MPRHDRTGIVVPPPLLFAGPFFAGWLLGWRWEWRLLRNVGLSVGVGAALVVIGAGVAWAGIREFRKARTTILPFGGTMRIVSSGIYQWTRNPMYVGMALAHVGFALIANSAWCLLTLPFAVLLARLFAIGPEERYLASKFGQEYGHYCARVRRWL